MHKVLRKPSHVALKNHIQELAKIKADYETDIARALEAIQYMNALKANSPTCL